jgi:muramoyltetrapeptide carboxypeptidase LdcA involved in peptidoglycan recycling
VRGHIKNFWSELMNYVKPRKLESGDTVAILSPSWGGPSVFPDVYDNGLHVLESWGLRIKEYPTTRADAGFLQANPKIRAQDINDAFADPGVKAIIASIGGDDAVKILPYLDKEVLRDNPKILMGYSDTSALLIFCNQLGLVTFNGPTIMAGFSQMVALPKEFELHVKDMLFSSQSCYEYKPYRVYADGYPDWSDETSLGQVNALRSDTGWRWLQGTGAVRGKLLGGCVEVLEMVKATEFWPPVECWDGKILFLETSEEVPSLEEIKAILMNYGERGILNRVKGLLFGRARDFSDEQKIQLEELLVSVVEQFKNMNLPILANVDFGHTDPQFVLPLGIEAEIDCEKRTFKLVESWSRA